MTKASATIPGGWYDDVLTSTSTGYLSKSLYKSYLEFAATSATPIKLTHTTTTGTFTTTPYPYSSGTGTVFGTPSKTYTIGFDAANPRISTKDLHALVDKLVKERHPAYEPPEHVEF